MIRAIDIKRLLRRPRFVRGRMRCYVRAHQA
jgi:hypothetical protein